MSDEELEQFECSECGTIVKENDKVCPNCGADLIDENEEYEFECSECGAAVKPDDAVCPKCGAVLDESEEEGEIVQVGMFDTEVDATLAIQYLSENGIESYIGSSRTSYVGTYTICSVCVFDKDLAKAKNILTDLGMLK